MESKDTAWRVTKADLKKNEKYDQYQEMIEEMLQRTDTEYAPGRLWRLQTDAMQQSKSTP